MIKNINFFENIKINKSYLIKKNENYNDTLT